MTRYTSIGYKRKYLEAGFNHDIGKAAISTNNEQAHVLPLADSGHQVHGVTDDDAQLTSIPPKRRRIAKVFQKLAGDEAKTEVSTTKEKGQADTDAIGEKEADGTDSVVITEKKDKLKKKGKMKKNSTKKISDAALKQSHSEQRRLKRIRERHADTVCFACREIGHAAKDCTAADTALEGEKVNPNNTGNALGKNAVGMCYRCGSKTHSLSRCKRRENPANPLPFATCFVCSARGHLASSCPQNGGRGVYPKGGACKICGETSHLARNCKLRSEESSSGNAILGIGMDTMVDGDEDDFHIFNRRKADVEKEERNENRARRNVKMGALTGVVKTFPIVGGRAGDARVDNSAPRVAKKVVYF